MATQGYRRIFSSRKRFDQLLRDKPYGAILTQARHGDYDFVIDGSTHDRCGIDAFVTRHNEDDAA